MRALVFNLIFIFLGLNFSQAYGIAIPKHDEAASLWDAFLKTYLDPKTGKVDYVKIAESGRPKLKKIMETFGEVNHAGLSENQMKANYINFYNAGMIFNVFRYLDTAKIDPKSKEFLALKIDQIKVEGGNIWNGSYKFKYADQMLNLDNIEQDLLRGNAKGGMAKYKVAKLDPRLHVAVNCAAISCPRVREKAYRDVNIDKMLDENLAATLANQDQFQKVSEKKARVNSIFFWYYADFDKTARDSMKLKGAGDYLAQHVPSTAKDAEWLKTHLKNNFNDRGTVSLKLSSSFDFYYNWQINDVRN